MFNFERDNLILDTDSYKLSHYRQYPPGTEAIFAYLEARGGRYARTRFFGLQPILKRLAQGVTEGDAEEGRDVAKAHGEPFPFEGWLHIARDLGGKIPLRIRALPEGSLVPVRTPLLTAASTDRTVPWVATWFETQLMRVWYPTSVCTKSFYGVRTIWEYLKETSNDPRSEISFKLHDFGGRGVSSFESAGIGGGAHLINSLGTDTIPALKWLARHYGPLKDIAGYSIPAMEHSTVIIWKKPFEAKAFANMIKAHPEFKILACVSDSYDIEACVENLWGDELLDLVRESGKLVVIRPDSGDAAETTVRLLQILERKIGMGSDPKRHMTTNMRGFKVLPAFFRIIWGDGNKTEDDLRKVLQAMKEAGYSASNIAFGMGGGLLQLVDRDLCQFAYKPCAAYVDGEWIATFKEPKTDTGKRSKGGLLDVIQNFETKEYSTIVMPPSMVADSPQPWNFSMFAKNSAMGTVFENGNLPRLWTLDQVRERDQHLLYA